MTAQKYDMMLYNIQEKKLGEAKVITPGIKAPTIMKLSADSDGEVWYAVQVMVLSKETGKIMDSLSAIGATGILVMDIKNCRT